MSSLSPASVVERMIRRAFLGAVLGTFLCAGVASVVAGPPLPVAGSALVAGGVVTGSLTAGLAAVRWLLTHQDAVVMPGAFAILLVVAVLLLAVALVLREVGWVHRPTFAASALAVAVVFQVGLVQAYLTGPRPLVEVPMPGPRED